MICNECHSTVQPNYTGACVTCLRRELAQVRADRDAAIAAGKVLAEEVRSIRGPGWCSATHLHARECVDANPLAPAWLNAAQEASNGTN